MSLSVATDRLLYIHLGRTGGMFFHNVLRNIKGLRILSHTIWRPSYKQLVEVYREAGVGVPPAVVFMRNPWAWYVAMWAWVCSTNYENMRGPFRGYMDALQKSYPGHPPLWTLSRAWQNLGADNATLFGRFENLCDDIVRVLLLVMADLTTEEEIREIMQELPRYHPSRDFTIEGPRPLIKHYSEYYDDDLGHRVVEWDAELIERFGYIFDRPV